MSEPRQYWLRDEYKNDKYEFFSCEIANRKPNTESHNESDFKDCLHVIEYSAYEDLKKEFDRIKVLADKWENYERTFKLLYKSYSSTEGVNYHVPVGTELTPETIEQAAEKGNKNV